MGPTGHPFARMAAHSLGMTTAAALAQGANQPAVMLNSICTLTGYGLEAALDAVRAVDNWCDFFSNILRTHMLLCITRLAVVSRL
jgi:hypothetical protein